MGLPARADRPGGVQHQIAPQRHHTWDHMVEKEVGDQIGIVGVITQQDDGFPAQTEHCRIWVLDDNTVNGPVLEHPGIVGVLRLRMVSQRNVARPFVTRYSMSTGPVDASGIGSSTGEDNRRPCTR